MDEKFKSDISPLGNIQPVSPAAKERIVKEKEEQEREKQKKREKDDDEAREKDRFESSKEDERGPKITPHKRDKEDESGLGVIIDITVE